MAVARLVVFVVQVVVAVGREMAAAVVVELSVAVVVVVEVDVVVVGSVPFGPPVSPKCPPSY